MNPLHHLLPAKVEIAYPCIPLLSRGEPRSQTLSNPCGSKQLHQRTPKRAAIRAIAHSLHPEMRLPRHQPTKRRAKRQVSDNIKHGKREPLHHISTLGAGCMLIQLPHKLVDVFLNRRLLLRQRFMRECGSESFLPDLVLRRVARGNDVRCCIELVEIGFEE